MNDFYVYQYLRNDGTPYYIGKGKKRRAYEKHGKIAVPGNDRIEFVVENVSEAEAITIEVGLIEKYGRKDLGTGILHNRTNGGDGLSNPSLETRKKMSHNARTGVTGMKGKVHSDETKKLMSDLAKTRTISKEHRQKIGESLRGRKEDPEVGRRRGKLISLAKKGKSNGHEGLTHSEDTKEKMRETRRKLNYKHSEEVREKMRGPRAPLSEERKQEISRKMKEIWAARRKTNNESTL